ncbi:MAG: hypothetical protein ABIP48_22900, partial [Planctomycetota bacterium]
SDVLTKLPKGIESLRISLHPVDLCILLAYLLTLAWIGVYFAKRQFKREDFFLARKGMTWLPIGLSLMAALNSGIDYLMQPSAVIKYGLVLLVVNLSWLLLYPYVFFVTLPLYRLLAACQTEAPSCRQDRVFHGFHSASLGNADSNRCVPEAMSNNAYAPSMR